MIYCISCYMIISKLKIVIQNAYFTEQKTFNLIIVNLIMFKNTITFVNYIKRRFNNSERTYRHAYAH